MIFNNFADKRGLCYNSVASNGLAGSLCDDLICQHCRFVLHFYDRHSIFDMD